MLQESTQAMPSADQMGDKQQAVCAGCGSRILERFYLMAVDQEWHADCLKCSDCELRLDNELTCFSKDGVILCREDYYRRFSVKKCSSCSQAISSKELVMRARDQVYHVNCFACDRCKRMLATGEYFGMRGIRIYCKEDYEELLREESRNPTKINSLSKGRPRKRRIATAIESITNLGYDLSDRPGELTTGADGRPKRVRTSFKHHQLRAMKTYFAMNHNPDAKDLKQLSQKTGLTKRVLQVWFQNARAKFRRTVCNTSQTPMSPSCDQLTPSSGSGLTDLCENNLV
ncbi:LIM/homeobox protein Lhx9 isoform X2 [Nematostella vectensis]|uniref:LIM/homeobox protein Lhx9 isoform X2 n=1 Tax=Nematostella vectensis TaxID=45351 RepID=UPI0013903BE4|nr:LIM/homeobox protein Lhx9 isoform X2 [Nematostella vectensis]